MTTCAAQLVAFACRSSCVLPNAFENVKNESNHLELLGIIGYLMLDSIFGQMQRDILTCR